MMDKLMVFLLSLIAVIQLIALYHDVTRPDVMPVTWTVEQSRLGSDLEYKPPVAVNQTMPAFRDSCVIGYDNDGWITREC